MKKAIIFAVVAFLASLGGTTGYLVRTHKAPVAAVDSLVAKGDSTRSDSTHADTTHRESVGTDTARASRHDSTAEVAATDATPPSAATASAAPPAKPAQDPIAKAGAYKQVARVLSAMKPPEAAKVIAFLTDDEVEGLLRSVGPRQAADFLTNIPKERAAVLSRRLLTPRSVGATR
ncbi:MAG: hypothetical protein ABI587_00490 [Gemmatimonadales bacterium]